ncbi:hypothetical protein GCM10010363_69870 [Streptomyces omiyaensis]|nr:hypothetical protein GCM10010363_69870 [Streptomyces omiyaensis]
MPDLVSPEKSTTARFDTIRDIRALRAAELPMGSRALASPARPTYVHVRNDSVNDVCDEAVPCGGTRSEVVARRAGARGAIGVRRSLSTGRPVQAAEVIISRTAVPRPRFAPRGGVRFGWYTTAMTACTALSAPAPLYVRASSMTLVGGAR